MERISKKRKAKAEKPQFPKLRSKYGVTHSFRFSLRAWFNFKLYALVFLMLVALAVAAFVVLEPADFSGEKFTDAFYTFDENVDKTQKTDAAENAAISQSPVRLVGGSDMILFAEAHNHVWEETNSVVISEADCQNNGLVNVTEKCSVCEETRTRIVETAKATHKPAEAVEEPIAAPTCDTAGSHYVVVSCEVCSAEISRTKVIDAPLGHTPADSVKENIVNPADCVTAGHYESVVYCTECSVEISRKTVIIPTSHTEQTPVKENEVPVTCTTDGSYDSVVYCHCGEKLSSEKVIVFHKGHTAAPGVKENIVVPTCTEDGSHDDVVYCEVCSEELSRDKVVDEATGHSYENCLDFSCNSCGFERPQQDHAFDSNYVVDSKDATCTEAGYVVYHAYCHACGEYAGAERREDIPATGHKYTHSCSTSCNVCDAARPEDEIVHSSAGPATCTEASVCENCDVELQPANGHKTDKCRDEQCIVCEQKVEPKKHVDANGDYYCDRSTCRVHLRDLNPMALLYTICLVGVAVAAIWFLILTIMLIVTAFKVSSMRLDFYDDVMVWRWGRVFKRHIEQRFIGVYDVLAMPRNKLYYKNSKESKKPAKYGTVLAKVPGGGYEWNRKFFGVKEYVQLVNYLKSKKIGEGSVVLEHDTGVKFKG